MVIAVIGSGVAGIAAAHALTARGLPVTILDVGRFHDFYGARSHVDWVTQMPVLLASELGVRDTRLLAMVYSATLSSMRHNAGAGPGQGSATFIAILLGGAAAAFASAWWRRRRGSR